MITDNEGVLTIIFDVLACDFCKSPLACSSDIILEDVTSEAIYAYKLAIGEVDAPCYSATRSDGKRVDLTRLEPRIASVRPEGPADSSCAWFPGFSCRQVVCNACRELAGWAFYPKAQGPGDPTEAPGDLLGAPEGSSEEAPKVSTRREGGRGGKAGGGDAEPEVAFFTLIVTKLNHQQLSPAGVVEAFQHQEELERHATRYAELKGILYDELNRLPLSIAQLFYAIVGGMQTVPKLRMHVQTTLDAVQEAQRGVYTAFGDISDPSSDSSRASFSQEFQSEGTSSHASSENGQLLEPVEPDSTQFTGTPRSLYVIRGWLEDVDDSPSRQ
eukprot:NODE_2730_length_1133_cov_3.009225_g2507_i0.p1 GENE.NODE_2730_length_1133_cov_3.009225_g2507_i0~~NODE_2730_length_1133_cov_3.009225_g2507_i0.p1  ORF type:complete len:329 (-),score=49.91 NODE_2730_length_1133_cov_3.009225_g2507_i0:67-1053(-)